MPEGVEVKLSVDLIKPLVIGKKIISLSVGPDSRYKTENPEGLDGFKTAISSWRIPTRVTEVASRGKFMYWSFNNDEPSFDWHLMCTFGMSGQWSPIKGKHPCFWMTFDDGSSIYFNDPRHFGTIKFVNSFAKLNAKRAELGWDPLNDGTHEKWQNHVYNNILQKTNKPIGQVLMDQGVFAGVGNYIRAEALYLAKMSPWVLSKTITRPQFDNLCKALIDVMNDSYTHQGATILTYKDAYGAEGKYSSCFKVYGKKIDPNGYPVVKEETPDKRTIHWCPSIQDPLHKV